MADTLHGLIDRLAIPGLPSWVGLVILLAIGISVLAFLAMPYSVFGVKSRLEAIEAELADLRAEIRALVRQPGASARAPVEEDYVAPPRRAEPRIVAPEPSLAPPVPPLAARPLRGRNEPRFDRPKADRGA
ncbi:hypothetical protein [Roseomonas sp. CECT 9278]|uniref:hypothetical protein n=1 Tax=Roseomonas sp. CECT 9278 TaxID=2845823 RepID=UPI001E5BAB80|nr:hypothetical protein [Roseomonas sp. CECT 9278]CAH0265054.1 hypothetical protein ROS9278_03502 [Roseomonas sp. CECT 9278]